MSLSGRRSSILNIDTWLDRCPSDEPDSLIYDPDYANEVATVRTRLKLPELEGLYRVVTDVCTKIGLAPPIVEERLGDIDECISTYLISIQKDVQDEYDKLCEYKLELLNQITKILNDLHLPPYVPDENVTLLQYSKRLKNKFNTLNELKQKRLNKLQQLRDKQIKLCSSLGIQTPQVEMQTDIPSEDELVKLSNAISDLEKEEVRRTEKYSLMKDMISKCMEQVEYLPETEFENKVLVEKPCFSESYLREMSVFHSKLEAIYVKNDEQFKKLQSRLISLYNRLDVSQEERSNFFEQHSSCKPSLMVEMEVEIERYEELKRQNIGKFIEKIKEELVGEYERCFVSQVEQDNFFSLSNVSGECSEELLELYERELDRIKEYYSSNREFLEKIQKWRVMWQEMMDLEVKTNDPSRFNNRGGQLLIEERKRRTLQKGIPKIEKELAVLDENFSTRNQGNKIKIYGNDLNEYMAACWDQMNAVKEEEKREKKERQKAKLIDQTARGIKPNQAQVVAKKTPSKRAAAAGITPTPSKIYCQRSVMGTPSSNIYKSSQLALNGSVKKSTQKNLFPTNKTARGRQPSGDKSSVPAFATNNQINRREKPTNNSNGSDFGSALSLSEQEFEDIISTCPASARKRR